MDKMNNKPLFNIEEFPDTDIHIGGYWTRQRYPGLDALINAVLTVPPWERLEFLDHHFELVDWPAFWRSLSGPVPGLTMDTDPASVLVYRLSSKPLMVAVIWKSKTTYVGWSGRESIEWHMRYTHQDFYCLMWRLW